MGLELSKLKQNYQRIKCTKYFLYVLLFLFKIQNIYSQETLVLRGVTFVNENDLKTPKRDTSINIDFLNNSSIWRKDTLLRSEQLISLNLFNKKIYINTDAIKLIKRLNPLLSDTALYLTNTKLIIPEFPKEKGSEKRKNKKELRKLNTPDSSLNSVFKNQMITLNRKFKQLDTFNFCRDSISDLIDDLNSFATRYYNTGRGNMRFITLIMDSLIEKMNSYYYSSYQRQSCSEIISIIKSIDRFIPTFVKINTYPFENFSYANRRNSNFGFTNSVMLLEETNNEEKTEQKSSNPKKSLSFHIYVYDSKKEPTPDKVFKDKGLLAQYTIMYRCSKYYSYETCGKKASFT